LVVISLSSSNSDDLDFMQA